MELLHVPEAARELGVSYPTLKQWIYKRKIRTVTTPGGHHRVPRSEIDRLFFKEASEGRAERRLLRLSLRPPRRFQERGRGSST